VESRHKPLGFSQGYLTSVPTETSETLETSVPLETSETSVPTKDRTIDMQGQECDTTDRPHLSLHRNNRHALVSLKIIMDIVS